MDLLNIRLDGVYPKTTGDGNPVVSILHEIDLPNLVYIDRWNPG